MKKETLKETGKFFLDLSKIIFAVAILAPLVTSGAVNVFAVAFGTATAIVGIYITNKGAKDE